MIISQKTDLINCCEPGGEIATYINPQGGKTKYFYTTDGKLRRQENPDGTLQELYYRLDGRLDKEVLSDGTYWQMSYDDEARIITRTRKNSSDPDQMLSQETYAFDRRGNVISYTDQDGKTNSRQYDKLNRLKVEIAPGETPEAPQRRTEIAYNGNTVTITNAQGEKQILTKDTWGRITSILVQDVRGQNISETTYTYSPENRSITETSGSVTTTTTFDALGNPVSVDRVDSEEGLATQIWNFTLGNPRVQSGLMVMSNT